ncbi:MAG TPA: hypothetical protein VGR09_10210 [Gemmatimonadales bacterium]|nr:hypothetical protein [Gemmatimonadales bacterium]
MTVLAPLIGARPESIRLAKWDTTLPLGAVGEPGALAKALTEVIRALYGSRLSPKDLSTIAQQIQNGLERVDQLKKVNLANGDEPDFVFTPSRPPLGPHD